MLEYQNIKIFLQKFIFLIGLKNFFAIKKVTNTVQWTYVVNDLNAKEIVTKRNCKKQIKNNLDLKKVMQRKGNKLYVKSKGYDNLFNSWIDKKDIV